MREKMARAMYDDNLRQQNAIRRKEYENFIVQHGHAPHVWNEDAKKWLPPGPGEGDFVLMVQQPFDEIDGLIKNLYLSYADACLDVLSAPPTEGMFYAGQKNYQYGPLNTFEAMIRAAKDGK